MKIDITNSSAFVERMFVSCGPYQWAREFLKNSVEAGAKRIEFGIEWQAVEKFRVYRQTIIDDGIGMRHDDLTKFFSTLGLGGKPMKGVHDNFGIGAKISSLPWNPQGVVVMSYKDGVGSMIDIELNQDGEYELLEFECGDGKRCCIEPTEFNGIDWAAIRPKWLTDHGTVIVLLGSKEYPDTILGNEGRNETTVTGVAKYLNTRFWDLLSSSVVRVVEVASDKKHLWPRSAEIENDKAGFRYRQVKGAKHYLAAKDQDGKEQTMGTVALLDGRVTVEWHLWNALPIHSSYARSGGYVGIRYKDELFEVKSDKATFRAFGITEGKIQSRLSLIVEPQRYDGKWGVSPDQSRTRMIFSGSEDRGMPLNEWGLEFAHNMPDAIREAIRLAREAGAGTIRSDEYRKRLQDKFGSRWSTSVQAAVRTSDNPTVKIGDAIDVLETGISDEHSKKQTKVLAMPRIRPTVKIVKAKPRPDIEPTATTTERSLAVDVPRYDFTKKESFDKQWHIALWDPNNPEGPTVLINMESPILEETIKWHQQRYHDDLSEQIAKEIMEVFGELACCKVAHSQKLTKYLAEEEITAVYRNEAALTISLMGLLAEDTLITQRLSGLCVKAKAKAT